jgi:hypothetical protein
MSYTILRGCWCDITVLNENAPTEDKCDNIKDSFYEEISMQRWGGKIFLNRQLGMRVCTKLVMIMGLE